MAQSNNIQSANRMSARQLVISENSAIQRVINPNTNKAFFVCGSKRGYISPAANSLITAGKATLDDLQYAEVSIDGNPAVPCLMVVGNSNKNVTHTLGAELLH